MMIKKVLLVHVLIIEIQVENNKQTYSNINTEKKQRKLILCINCLVIIVRYLSSFSCNFSFFFFSFNSKSINEEQKKKETSLNICLFSSVLYYVSICFLSFLILVSILFVQECMCVCTALLCTKKPCMKKLVLILKKNIFCIYMFFLSLHYFTFLF
jgi:hypothetical protein